MFLELMRAFRRRWSVVLVGALCTAAIGMYAAQQTGVYWTRTNLVFLAPSSSFFPNSLKTSSEDLIITAGLVAKRINGPSAVLKYSSSNTTMIGTPDSGSPYWLRLPDTGGQWASNFPHQYLILEVMSASPERVLEIQQDVVARAREELDAMQREQGVDPVNDITITVEPSPPTVEYVTGSRTRALGMVGALGLGGTIAIVVALEYRARRGRLLAGESALTFGP